MKYLGLLLAIIMAATGAHAADAIDSLVVEKDATETVLTSLAKIEELAKSTQKQFWQLVPPSGNDLLYIHPDHTVRAVDWKSKEWPDTILKQMIAEMGTVGRSGSLYPFYKLTVVETRDGELVYYNSYYQEVWRTPAPLGYNEYLFAFQSWNVDSVEDLTFEQKMFGRSSNVGLEMLLLPKVFIESYEQDVALEAELMAFSEPLAMMSMQTVTNLTMGIGTTESNEVEVGVYFPSGYTNPVDVFFSTSLMDWDWALFTNISSANTSEYTWIDETATNAPTHYWVAARSDVFSDIDSLSDSYEIYLYGTSPTMADTDGDGIDDDVEIANGTNPLFPDSDGDGMGDGAEAELAVSVAANGSGGVLVLVPQTGWYHATDPILNFVYLGE